jgi:hypothetical protein
MLSMKSAAPARAPAPSLTERHRTESVQEAINEIRAC